MFTNRLFTAFRLFTALIAIVFVAILTLIIGEAIVPSAGARNDQAQEAQLMQRSREAAAARWEAVGKYYSARQALEAVSAASIPSGRAADAQRWEAMGAYYAASQALEAQRIQESRHADAARWEALGEYYAASQASNK